MLTQSALGINILNGINRAMDGVFRSLEKLSSGLRINRASDDPAGLVISEQMRSRIASLNQEIENISHNMFKYSTADSAALELRHALTDMRTYALEAAGAGYADENTFAAWQGAVDGLVSSYNFIVDSTSFGTQKLLDGSAGSVANVAKLEQIDVSSAEAAAQAVETIDSQIAALDQKLVAIGARQHGDFESRRNSLRIEMENLTAAESSIRDTDYVAEYSNLIRNKLVVQMGLSLLAHSHITSRSVLNLIGNE